MKPAHLLSAHMSLSKGVLNLYYSLLLSIFLMINYVALVDPFPTILRWRFTLSLTLSGQDKDVLLLTLYNANQYKNVCQHTATYYQV
jgi:hypothetical protein